jgi:mannose-6-phosphate isomerase-like protein (cupin superfamily)
MTTGPVARAADAHVDHAAAGTRVRTLLDTGPPDAGLLDNRLPDTRLPDTRQAGLGLVRRLAEIPPGALLDGTAGSAGELWFVIGGRGRLASAGQAGLPLGPDRGLWIPPDMKYRIYAAGPADLLIDAVTLPAGTPEPGRPAGAAAAGHPEQRDQATPQARDLRDCEVETTGDRRFRVLFGPGQGCAAATQFLGEIPAGRAPEHSHPYDEVVLVLEGAGVLHLNGADSPLSAGTCVHLPRRQLHCLENTGAVTMRVLGVFHPADSPAAKAEMRL